MSTSAAYLIGKDATTMIASFAYSFDRETYHGHYPTRQQALDAALKALRDRADQPEGIFVGRWVEPDLQTTGHAMALLEAMRDRWNASLAEGEFLERVTEQEQADLDAVVAGAIRGWLEKHELLPRSKKVRAVSEYPVPNVHDVHAGGSLAGERQG